MNFFIVGSTILAIKIYNVKHELVNYYTYTKVACEQRDFQIRGSHSIKLIRFIINEEIINTYHNISDKSRQTYLIELNLISSHQKLILR